MTSILSNSRPATLGRVLARVLTWSVVWSAALALTSSVVIAQKSDVTGKVVWQSGYQYVSIVPGDGRPVSSRPAKVPTRSLQRALRNIKVKATAGWFADRDKKIPLLTEETANLLGKILARAFKRTKPGQDVLFRIGDEANLFGNLLERTRFTAGRAFWYKGRLHIIFGGIHKSPSKHTKFGQESTTELVGAPKRGSRTRETDLDFAIIREPGISYVFKNRGDWIALSPGRIRAPSAVGGGERGTVETRLRKLQRLYKEGLIDEREYRARKRELLDDL